jgi:hypothetical protein
MTTPTVLAWGDGQFVGDGREEKLLNGFELRNRSVLLFRTAFLGRLLNPGKFYGFP